MVGCHSVRVVWMKRLGEGGPYGWNSVWQPFGVPRVIPPHDTDLSSAAFDISCPV
jgi:hypothetical protein